MCASPDDLMRGREEGVLEGEGKGAGVLGPMLLLLTMMMLLMMMMMMMMMMDDGNVKIYSHAFKTGTAPQSAVRRGLRNGSF